MTSVFVSYSRADLQIAKRVAELLEVSGYRVYMDQQCTSLLERP
jgi:hypothetical protein